MSRMMKLPDGSVRLVQPPFAGKLAGFTLLFEALALMLSAQMPCAAVARIAGVSPYWVLAICRRYVSLALEAADFSAVTALAIDETSRARGHDYITLAVSADVKLTHLVGVNLTHLGEDRGIWAASDVDLGAGGGDTSAGPSGDGDSGDRAADGLFAQHGQALPA